MCVCVACIGISPPSPKNLTATSTSNTITLTWTPVSLSDLVERYMVVYTYTVDGCSGTSSQVMILINSSSVGELAIMNSPQTPIEEDSVYNITLTCVNDDGIQSSAVSTIVRTPQAGMQIVWLAYFYYYYNP